MEAGPPEVAERVVRWLLPPASREHVLGDLHERYESPGRFVLEALKALPFVIASRLRRTVNPGLSAFLALYFWFGVFWGTQQTHWFVAVIPALASVASLALRDVYRAPTALTPYRSAVGDVIVAALAVLTTQGWCALFAPAWLVTGATLRIGFPFGFIVLFFLRLQMPTGLHQPVAVAQARTMQELIGEIDRYELNTRRAVRIELGAAVLVMALFAAGLIFGSGKSAVLTLGISLSIAGAAFVGVFLYRHARLRPIVRTDGFMQLVAQYRIEIERRLRLSQTYLWWYVVPLSLGPAVILIGFQLGKPDTPTRIAITAGLLSAFAAMLVFAQKPLIRKMQQRLERLSVVTERH